jgi:hypothetical protein
MTPRALRDEPIPLRSDRAALLTSQRRGLMRGLASAFAGVIRTNAGRVRALGQPGRSISCRTVQRLEA